MWCGVVLWCEAMSCWTAVLLQHCVDSQLKESGYDKSNIKKYIWSINFHHS